MELTAIDDPYALPQVPGYTIVERMYESSRTAVYRAVQDAQQRLVVIKLLMREYPNFNELVRFRNQYTIAKNLMIPGIVRPLNLEPWQNAYALIMEDWGGISLGQYAKVKSLAWPEVLAIALQLADILDDLRKYHVVHKDIKPANILVHPESHEVKLIDFSISSLLSRETQAIKNPQELEGTLAYIAPEQTGRMNRGIDYRVDFYGLGVTLYELLTGKLPFQSEDPLALVHCHIAKIPTLPHQINSAIPPVVSDIVLKLMAKNAEDRYQNSSGLKHDLGLCLHRYQETGAIAEFELGLYDFGDHFLIPEKLYGREVEVQTLLDAFERVANGSSEMMLIAGFSGIGKTAVVNEVHKPITQRRGYFVRGKFDQFNRNIPFSAFVQALRDLMGQLFSESDTQLAAWRARILEAVGENGQVLIEVIPELEQVIGQQPPVPEIGGAAAQNRFKFLFQQFVQVFMMPQHPLVMFLDDLQWADPESLKLIQLLTGELQKGYLLLIGAYRDNEVSAAHPLTLAINQMGKTKANVSTLTLKPLSEESLNQLVADTLACPIESRQLLTQLLYQKTQGNPFFATQFLKALHNEGYITFNCQARHWQCNMNQIRTAAITDNVVTFMVGQLQKFPSKTQEVLKLAACIGNQFDLETLAIVAQQSETATADALWRALQEGLILSQSDAYKLYLEQPDKIIHTPQKVTYRFLHDRVQQAAYNLIPEDQKQATHLKIGQLLLQNTSEPEVNLFEIVNHWNIAIDLIDGSSAKTQLARLNWLAGRKARASVAYEPALQYFETGLNLLDVDCWQTYYELALDLHEGAAKTAFICGNYEQMEQWSEVVLQYGRTVLDKVRMYDVQVQAQMAQAKPAVAIQIALEALKLLDIKLPETPTSEDIEAKLKATEALWADQDISKLSNLPLMTDPEKLAAIILLSSLFAPAFIAKPEILPLIACQQIQLSIQYGNCEHSAFGYSNYSAILSTLCHNLDASYEFGQLAIHLVERLNAKGVKARTFNQAAIFSMHGKVTLQQAPPILQEGCRSGIENGDLEFAGYAAYNWSQYSYFSGLNLIDLQQSAKSYGLLLDQINQQISLSYNQLVQQAALNLLGESENPCHLKGEVFNEEEALKSFLDNQVFSGVQYLFLHKIVLCFLFSDLTNIQEYVAWSERYLSASTGMIMVPAFYFFATLSRLQIYANRPVHEQSQIWTQIDRGTTEMHRWAEQAPMNFQHKSDLIAAERKRVLNELYVAADFYDRAIAGARENGYVQEEALASELAAKFYLDWGKEKVAAGYLQEAYSCYARWGAKAKTDDLEKRYPQLLSPILRQSTPTLSPFETVAEISNFSIHDSTQGNRPSSSSSINTTLDLTTVLKASQVLSGTIQLDELLRQLTQIILQNSGGDRCALVLPNSEEEWCVEAIAVPETTELHSTPLEGNPHLPVRLIQYVKNTQEVALIDDLETDLPVIDAYLNKRRPKSLLCSPLLNQGQLIGILALENQSTSGVFTEDRLLILNFLCTQAAISLENAKLYEQSQSYAKQLEKSVQTLEETQGTLIQNKREMQRQLATIFELSTSQAISLGNLQQAFKELTDATARTLQVERVGVWLFDEERTKIQCIDLYELSSQSHSQGAELFVVDYPYYFDAIATEPMLSADDAQNDSRTCEFKEVYSGPLKISSMLDSNIQLDGETSGVVCCEHVGSKRTWTQAEQNFVRSIANLVALTIESHRRHQETWKLKQALSDLAQTQLQLVQNEKMASLGNLVAGVAHEVNNPTGFLKGSVRNVQDYIQDLFEHLEVYQRYYPDAAEAVQENAEAIDLEFVIEDLPKLLGSMKGATDRIENISNSLRTFSRADTEHKVSANLHEGLDSTLLILKYRLKANDYRPAIHVVKNYGELPLVDCFPGQLNQVFMNVLANAIDVFDEAAQQLSFAELEAQPQQVIIQTIALAEENTVEIHIRDNGMGMTEAVKAKIFDHLFTTKGVGEGTGLGLAIARQIVTEKHDGRITVNSVVGEGTEFIIELPIRLQSDA